MFGTLDNIQSDPLNINEENMKKLLLGASVTMALLLSGCGEKVEVPPASVGMVLGPDGYTGDLIPPSRFRLDPCLMLCDKLVVVVAGDMGAKETMDVLMPKDNLILGVTVQFTIALSKDKAQIATVFDRVTPQKMADGQYGMSLEHIYATYGEGIVRNVVRASLAGYTIAEVSANQDAISEKLRRNIATALAKTPLEVKQFGLAGLEYPDTIKLAMTATAQKRVDIERVEAESQVKLREARTRLEVLKAQREADILEAETMAKSNKILAEGVTPEIIRLKELEVMAKMAENENVVFFPMNMSETALQGKVMQSSPKQ